MFIIKHIRHAFIIFISSCFSPIAMAQIVINEIMPANINSIQDEFDVDKQTTPVDDADWWFEQMGEATCNGDYPDWIELYNTTSNSINLNGYGLSDNPEMPNKWVFPSTTIGAKERLIVFASGKNIKNPEPGNLMHTNFKIDNGGETIILSNSSGAIIDQYTMGFVPPDFSCGRISDGDKSWVMFQNPTPDNPNHGIVFKGFTENITSSLNAGFYSSPISVILSSTTGLSQIRYTTDGSTPDINALIYESPIGISETTVLKARCYNTDTIKGEVMTATYFMHDNFSMPVVSLSTNPDNFWSEETGIYVHGNYPVDHERVANYWQDWERPVTIEFFETDGNREFTIDAGSKIMGWGSRSNARKSLSIFFRSKYGNSSLAYPIFDNLPFNNYKSLVLRAAGGDWQGTLIRDVLASDLVYDKNLDYQKFRPAIVFINGVYWGIHNIREKLNEDYLDSHYNLNKDSVDIIGRYWRNTEPIVIEGTANAYLEMENFISENNMNGDDAYDYAKAVIDLDNLIDYLTAEIYYANYDWPGNNIKFWKPRTPGSRWRWLFYDLDYTMNAFPSQNDHTHNTLEHATSEMGSGWPNTPITTFFIREMLESNDFRNAFVNRMADYMNSRFLADSALKKLDEIKNLYEAEIQEHIDKWGSYASTLTSLDDWNNNIEDIELFFENRSEHVKEHILDFFNLRRWNSFTMDISGKGKIKINSIIPGNYPWTGEYVWEIPVTLTALPEPGYEFSGWTGSSENSPHISILISQVSEISANFVQSSEIPSIVINEVNYHSSDELNAGDWIELYNPYSKDIDISGWKIKDSNELNEFSFPEKTLIRADGYLVVCRDSSNFENSFPAINNYIGTFNFGLGSDVQSILLFDNENIMIDSITYFSSIPWPVEPNGFGPTLSLIEPSTDNSKYFNWGYSTGFGTPGEENYINSNFHVNINKFENLSQTTDVIRLYQNYPNPASSVTYIPYFLPYGEKVTIAVMDIQGKEIANLFDGYQSPGNHVIEYQTTELPHGLYYYKIKSGDEELAGKMVKN